MMALKLVIFKGEVQMALVHFLEMVFLFSADYFISEYFCLENHRKLKTYPLTTLRFLTSLALYSYPH